jgi:hypothetical protein
VTGWRAPGPVRAHFAACARIVEVIPAFSAELPKGRLQDPGLPDALRDALAAAGALGAPGGQRR